MAITQDGRVLKITTPLGKDFLLIDGFTADEGVSKIFSISADVLHDEGESRGAATAIDPKSILGKNVTIEVNQPDGTQRHFNGIVNRFSLANRETQFSYFSIGIVPQVWLLTQNSQSRIFQHKSVPEILKEVFNGLDVKDETTGTYKPRNYCVQYRESDFDFASRLMEEEGIFYFFKHSDGSHVMVIADSHQSYPDCPSKSTIDFVQELEGEAYVSTIHTWLVDYRLQTGKVTLWDHNFELPTNKLLGEQPTMFSVADNSKLEAYDYPGGYARKYDNIDRTGGERSDLDNVFPDKDHTAQIAMQALDSQYKTATGTGDCSSMTSGHRFTFKKHPDSNINGKYMITAVEHRADQSPDYDSESESDQPYTNSFACVAFGESTPQFRSPSVTPKPKVSGSQTAVVVGPAGEEIFTDKYGRVKVQFHWDREGKNDADSSCWVRVLKDSAGNKWGTMYIPRIGQEVIVDFMEGDPDQPIITGCAYNAESMPHYDLPKYKTLTYIKTHTSPGGKGYNELRFEDNAKKEQVFLYSQKRMDFRARGSHYETCGGNRQETIGVGYDNYPGGNLAITVGGNYDLHVKGDQYIGVDTDLFEGIKGNVTEGYDGNQATVVKSKAEVNAREIILEALTGITLKVGGSFVKVDLTGVTIQGPIVKINSGGAATGTGPALMGDPLDAETADTGEPGYCDRPRRGGGGGGRRWRTLNGQHAPENITRNPNGTYQMGSIVVQGDEAYQQAVLSDLATMSTTTQGQNALNQLNSSGQTTTIRPLVPPANPANAFAQPGTGTNADYQNATAAGQPVFDGAGNPLNDSSGNQLVGTGTGGPSDIQYNPGDWPSPTSASQAPGDVLLFHEMQHSNNEQRGQFDGTPRTDGFDTNEEFNAIGPENQYRDERGVPRRTNHQDL